MDTILIIGLMIPAILMLYFINKLSSQPVNSEKEQYVEKRMEQMKENTQMCVSEEIQLIGKALKEGEFEYETRRTHSSFTVADNFNVYYGFSGTISLYVNHTSVVLSSDEKKYLKDIIDGILDDAEKREQQEARNKIKSILGENE